MEKFLISLDGKTWNTILKAIMQIDDTAIATINNDYLTLEALDSAHVAAIKVFLPNYFFSYFNYKDYEHEKLEFGFDVKPLYNTLKTFNKDTIDIALDDKTLSFKINNNFKFEFPVIETQKDFPIEKIESSTDFSNYVKLETKKLRQVINILKQRKSKYHEDVFRLDLNEKGLGIVFINHDTLEKLSFNFTDNLIAKNVKESLTRIFDIEYIIKLLGKEFSYITKIAIAPTGVLKVIYPLTAYESVEIAYYLAPKISE